MEETCEALWVSLVNTHMKMPTENEWKTLAERFKSRWNFPNCVGAIDGKHICFQAPPNSGSLFFNYKGTFCLVLMALVDADYCFSAVDIGSYGSNSDGGIFANSLLGQGLATNQLNLRPPVCLPGGSLLGPIPYVLWVMKLSRLKHIYCVHIQEKPCPLTSGFLTIDYPGQAEFLKMPLEFWHRDGEYFKGVSIYIPPNVKSWLKHAVFCIITCKNCIVMIWLPIIMKQRLISMKVMDCNIFQIWDAEPQCKHMLVGINSRHTFVWVMERFHGSMQQSKEVQQYELCTVYTTISKTIY